ncbi:dimeric dUTPase (all-alpha-NTP-PPase superfamily) [Virgibacillus natechei]|uniref:Dimeric dUTPase (All-alpha-NTP-PPase superfamily) n=1 Tax=Virgibacillus natechei TaxID=1216297 RepID=A0ABS4ID41_9BACI|nr:dUTP diphosphatase [Virgibacillus natechei]MBP1968851.1 dimeric dUTPase (all-alpha-NTP-PPase superfamily) [Virgibacillus natechei]UZD11648.1 dUTP diphosphatase [Virgibacillus natechei]
MDWKALFSMQAQLDKYIETKHDLLEKDVFQEKYLALLVELGELANETRTFKFWSNKPRNEKSVILEEYVDGVHFILSLGIDKGFRYDSRQLKEITHSETEQFNRVFEACVTFKQKPTQATYINLFEAYLQLGALLGFTEADIQSAYLKKNEVNYDRQNQGY